MPKVIALSNQKGGVAKTTTVFNVASILSEKNLKTLAIDLDPQANLTSAFGVPNNLTIYDVFQGERPEEAIQKINNLHLIPSSQVLARLERELLGEIRGSEKLSEKISKLIPKYDFILIDCPPSLGLLTLNGLFCSDFVIIPMEPEPFALEGLRSTLQIVEKVKTYNTSLQIMGILLIKFHKRYNLNQSILQYIQKNQLPLFNTKIRQSIAVPESELEKKPIHLYDPENNVSIDYQNFAKEVINYVQKA